jgi:hypothetical protein
MVLVEHAEKENIEQSVNRKMSKMKTSLLRVGGGQSEGDGEGA